MNTRLRLTHKSFQFLGLFKKSLHQIQSTLYLVCIQKKTPLYNLFKCQKPKSNIFWMKKPQNAVHYNRKQTAYEEKERQKYFLICNKYNI